MGRGMDGADELSHHVRVSPASASVVRVALERLDTMASEVTPWEADFLESVMRQVRAGRPLRPKQLRVVRRMCEQYLSPELAAELAGQQVLL